MNRHRRRALRAIERELVRSDPRLNALFVSLTGLANGRKMPDTEQIKTGPLRQLARLGRRASPSPASEDRRGQHPTSH